MKPLNNIKMGIQETDKSKFIIDNKYNESNVITQKQTNHNQVQSNQYIP